MYDANGTEITDNSKKLLTTEGAIINETAGTELAWSKVDGTSNSGALAGSEWQLTRTDTDPQQTWNITDNTTTPTSVSLLGADGNAIADLTLDKGGDTAPITVKVDPTVMRMWLVFRPLKDPAHSTSSQSAKAARRSPSAPRLTARCATH